MIASTLLGRWLGALLSVATAIVPVMPPAHIHLGADDHDHHHVAIEHSHWSVHASSRAGIEQGDDDGHVLFVDRPALVPDSQEPVSRPVAAILELRSNALPAAFAGVERQVAGNAPRDGPEHQVSLLRGPPVVR